MSEKEGGVETFVQRLERFKKDCYEEAKAMPKKLLLFSNSLLFLFLFLLLLSCVVCIFQHKHSCRQK